MKKHNLSKFLKSKSFYVLLSVGALAILVIAVVGFYQSSNDNRNNLADEGPKSEVVDEDNAKDNNKLDNDNKPPSSLTKNDKSKKKEEVSPKKTDKSKEVTESTEPTTDDKLLEYDAYQGPYLDTVDHESHDYLEETKKDKKEPVEAEEVMKPTTLHFDHEVDKLLWPVSGNVIRKYSIDSLVHYATLEQWKVSPAMLISAEEGEEVICSVDGIVTSIEENEETGITVTTSIGDGYNLIYGQLEKESLTLEEGDSIEKGQIIGSVSRPTRYNVVEGPSMYLQLVKGEETLNPMLCLE